MKSQFIHTGPPYGKVLCRKLEVHTSALYAVLYGYQIKVVSPVLTSKDASAHQTLIAG